MLPTLGVFLLLRAAMLVASFRASSRACMTSSILLGVMMASQVNGGEIDIHTLPCTTVTTTVASAPCMPLTEILRGIPIRGNRGRCSSGVSAFSLNGHTAAEKTGGMAGRDTLADLCVFPFHAWNNPCHVDLPGVTLMGRCSWDETNMVSGAW